MVWWRIPTSTEPLVGICLTVERTPHSNERLYGLGSAPAPAGRLPPWWWHPSVQHLTHRPNVIRNPGGHGGRLTMAVRKRERAMHTTEGIDRPDQIHPARHGRRTPGRPACTAPQDRQAAAEGAVQPFDERGIEHLTPRPTPELGQEQLHAAMHQPMERAAYHPSGILLDHLRDRQVGPANQARTSACPRLARPKRLAYRINVGHQPIADEQQRPRLRTGSHDRDQAPAQVAVTLGADRTAQPQPRADHHRHRHPQHARLGLDMHLVGLNLYQIAWLHQLGVMQCFGMRPGTGQPFPHRLRLEITRHFNRGDGTALTDQRDHLRDRVLARTPPKEDRAGRCAEGLGADRTAIALALLTMDADIPFADLPPCGTVHVRAECRLRIDDTPPSASSTETCPSIRSFFQVQLLTTVEHTPTRYRLWGWI